MVQLENRGKSIPGRLLFFKKNDSFIIIHLITFANLKRVHILYTSCVDIDTEIELSLNITDWGIEIILT